MLNIIYFLWNELYFLNKKTRARVNTISHANCYFIAEFTLTSKIELENGNKNDKILKAAGTKSEGQGQDFLKKAPNSYCQFIYFG